MSSPAMTVESSEHAQPSSTLLIIPDGSPLWSTPDPNNAERLVFGWCKDALTSLVEQLPVSNFPVLIGAEGRTAYQLLNCSFKAGLDWDNHLAQMGVAIVPRFVGSTYNNIIGSTSPDATRIELWFIPRDTFGHASDGWSSALRRLGFGISTWKVHEPLLLNLEKQRARNIVSDPTRPTAIDIGTFMGGELVTTQYDLG